jgi:inorganic pyrophosphatase
LAVFALAAGKPKTAPPASTSARAWWAIRGLIRRHTCALHHDYARGTEPDCSRADNLRQCDNAGGMTIVRSLVLVAALAGLLTAQSQDMAPDTLPAAAVTKLEQSLTASRNHTRHVWRDPPPTNADGTINAYIEIARGDRQKWELDMAKNARAIDRLMPESVGGYPVNYGFVPQTVSYDGDPFDALVLGPPIEGGRTVRGLPVGVMFMEDEKGLDSKIVLSLPGRDGRPMHALTSQDQQRIAEYFKRYKEHEPGAYSKVPGWGSVDEGLSLLKKAHAFFLTCRGRGSQPCHG